MLEVKNVKSFEGMEGLGYSATLYLNSKRVALAIDEGCGSVPHLRWEGKNRNERDANEKAVKTYVDGLPPEPCPVDTEEWMRDLYPNGFRKVELDDLLAKLVDDYENSKRLARQRKTSVPFRIPGQKKGLYYLMKHQGDVEGTKAYILKKHPEAIFI